MTASCTCPVLIARGKTPIVKAKEVITIGLKRNLAASKVASKIVFPFLGLALQTQQLK